MSTALACGRFYHNLWKKKLRELTEGDMPSPEEYSRLADIAKCWVLAEKDIHQKWADEVLKKPEAFEKGIFFLTIRPHDNLRFELFKEFVQDLFKKKCWSEWEYTYEQKGTTRETMGLGAHIHAILKVTTPSKGKAYFLNEILRFVNKKGLSEAIASNCVDLKLIGSQEDLQRRKNYTNTSEFLKADQRKEAAWNMDEPWRKSKSLPSLIKSVGEGNSNILALMNA